MAQLKILRLLQSFHKIIWTRWKGTCGPKLGNDSFSHCQGCYLAFYVYGIHVEQYILSPESFTYLHQVRGCSHKGHHHKWLHSSQGEDLGVPLKKRANLLLFHKQVFLYMNRHTDSLRIWMVNVLKRQPVQRFHLPGWKHSVKNSIWTFINSVVKSSSYYTEQIIH